jgi:hypothetical protein
MPDDPQDLFSQVRIVLETALAEVRDYNNRNNRRIKNLGFWVMTLADGIPLDQVIELLRELLSNARLGEGPA